MKITQALLQELFEYNPSVGKLINRRNRRQSRAGDEAGGVNSKGARRVKFGNEEYLTHRLVWMYVHGAWPSKFIDHVNGDPGDNRLSNLREATSSENSQNRHGISTQNTSGYRGVTQHKQSGKWQAVIGVARCSHYLGLFERPELAHQAYLSAKAHFHPFQPTL
jgi:hypothetical protein